MNLATFLNEANNLANPWPPQLDETSPHPVLAHYPERVIEERRKLLRLDRYIPTGFANIDKLASALVNESRAQIRYDMDPETSPNYDPNDDAIHLPPPAAFKDAPYYARTLLHELSHWTKAPERLDRAQDFKPSWLFFGIPPIVRGREELTAEMAASAVIEALEPELHKESKEYSLQYVHAWIRNMREYSDDTDAIDKAVKAAAKDARKAAKYLLSKLEKTA